MKILIYAFRHDKMGTGNLLRMCTLYNYLKSKSEITEIRYLLNNINDIFILKNLPFFNEIEFHTSNTSVYDIVLVDDPLLNDSTINFLKLLGKTLVAFDTSFYNNNINCIINLYNHFPEKSILYKNYLFSGVEYAIINPNFFHQKKNLKSNLSKEILISFGGEDPSSNTLKVLNKISKYNLNITVIAGILNKDIERINFFSNIKFLTYTNEMPMLMINSDLVFCGCGTTVIEALFIGNPIVCLPQNEYEKSFLNYLKEKIEIFDLKDINILLEKIEDYDFRINIKQTYNNIVDGKGVERIYNIIKKIQDQ